jgi:hypothetical protein
MVGGVQICIMATFLKKSQGSAAFPPLVVLTVHTNSFIAKYATSAFTFMADKHKEICYKKWQLLTKSDLYNNTWYQTLI